MGVNLFHFLTQMWFLQTSISSFHRCASLPHTDVQHFLARWGSWCSIPPQSITIN